MGSDPPTLVLGILRDPVRGYKDTARNIIETGEFVVNLVLGNTGRSDEHHMYGCAARRERDRHSRLDVVSSTAIAPPRIAASPVAFECRTLTTLITGPKQTLVVGRVLSAHIEDTYVLDAERAHVDTPRLHLIGRLHGSGWYARTGDMFQLDRPVYATWRVNDGG